MDQCFRIAVWMFFLVGYLQAAPFSMNMDDLAFDDLQGVKCENVTFTYPTNVTQTECLPAALTYFEKGFGDASEKCDSSHVAKTLLKRTKETLKQYKQTQATCNFNLTVHGEFADFVTAAETCVEAFISDQQLKKK